MAIYLGNKRVNIRMGIPAQNDCTQKHIIEVNELPSENISEKAVYLCDGTYYKYEKQFVNVVIYGNNIADLFDLSETPLIFHYVKTKPIDYIFESSSNIGHIYYVEDENDLFIYGDFMETGENIWVPAITTLGDDLTFNGAVSDESEAIDGIYAIVRDGWSSYLRANEGAVINTNGSHLAVGEITINVPNEALNGKWVFNKSIVEDFLAENGKDFEISPLYFTSIMDGMEVRFHGLRVGYNIDGEPFLEYWYRDEMGEASVWYNNVWQYDTMRTIDLGVEPQIVSAEVKRLMETHAIHIEEGSYDDGVEAGKKTEYDAFWDAFQQMGNRTYYRYAFYSQSSDAWTDSTYNPKYPIVAIGDYAGDSMFQAAQITDTKVDIEIGTNASYTFISCYSLKTIRKLIVSEDTTFNRWFDGCGALENVTFEGVIASDISFRDSTKLSKASVDSIVAHLKDLTGQTGKTLTLHVYVVREMTDAQKAAITAKNWKLVY